MPFLTDAQFNALKALTNPVQTKLAEFGITAPGNTQLNAFVDQLINLYYQEPTMSSYVDKREFWRNWDSSMPENLAQALKMIVIPTDTFEYDINKFVPTHHMINETFEQNYITSYKRSAGVSLELPILAGAFNNPQLFQGYVSKYRESNENAIFRFKYFNILYQLMFSDRAIKGKRVIQGTTQTDFDFTDIIIPPSKTESSGTTTANYLNPIVKKVLTFASDKAGNLNNDAFINLMQNYNNLKIPNQANYNLGDPVTNASGSNIKFGIPWSDTRDDYILFAPLSVVTKYLGSTNNSLGIAQVFNKKAVDIGMRFKRIELYDDISPKTTIRKVDEATGKAKMQVIDNPFYNPPILKADGTPKTVTLADGTKSPTYLYKHRFGVFNNQTMLLKTRFLKTMSQDWARNMANTTYLHTWFLVGICPFAQGFIYDLDKTS